MRIFAGIDGGGTKTECLVGDQTSILGRGSSVSSKIQRVGEEAARSALREAFLEGCRHAGITPAQVDCVCMGLAGVTEPEISSRIRTILGGLMRGEVVLVGDQEIALEAACAGLPGVVVIAGTGSIAYGRDAGGREARAGGWGPAVSDEGSGGWIGRRALGRVLRQRDEGRAPRLYETVQRVWKLRSHGELIAAANAIPPPDFAGLFPAVVEASQTQDRLASEVLEEAGAELAELAMIVITRLWPDPTSAVRVGLAGGAFRHSFLVRLAFLARLRSRRPSISLRFTPVAPVAGALALARKATAEMAFPT